MASSTQAEPSAVPNRVVLSASSKLNIPELLQNRQLGNQHHIGYNDEVAHKLYSSLDKYQLKNGNNCLKGNPAGIFNLEFSLDGHLLLAACENKCILMYDASNQKLIQTVNNAHSNCVNCVRFLDERTFATCSDDNTIKLWDIRKLKSEKKTLYAHSNWVKNIEYSERDDIMVTSAFDGSIYAWDLKNSNGNSMVYDKVFLMSGLMRTKLSPDGSQMVISTTGGYIILIHDLNLKTLAQDLRYFQPIIYRLMQTSGQVFPAGSVSNYLFLPTRQRNRVEFIDDFTFDAEVISSLQIHPQGWNAVSRSTNGTESMEMTCVHDIQKRNAEDYDNSMIYIEETAVYDGENSRPTDLWVGYVTNYQHERRLALPHLYDNPDLPSMEIISSGLIGRNPHEEYFEENPEQRHKIVMNIPRLTHYISEKNVGKGFIKELCYSSDGRVICSPFNRGIRLLGFSDDCQELSHCLSDQPKLLHSLFEMNDYHEGVVVSCKFNPMCLQLVSGCLSGEILWYKPVL